MTEPRQLASGKYQGIARHPSGKRATKVFPLKGQARTWAKDTEADWRRVGLRDPRAGKITAAAWHAKWVAARVRVKTTMKDNEQVWRLHVEPQWGTWPLDSITRMEVQGWAKKMLAAGAGIRTVQKSVSLLSMLLQAALDEDPPVLAHGRNPCRGVVAELPPAPMRPPTYFTVEEYRAILAVVEEDGEPWRTLMDLGFVAGLRWEELGGLLVRHVNLLHKILYVQVVLERDGTLREYPKSKRSNRDVPIPTHLLESVAALMAGKRRNDPVFTRPDLVRPTPLDYDRMRTVWDRAIRGARTCPTAKCGRAATCRDAGHRVPEYTPHSMRHSSASWLVMAGVDLYRVQALLGHESYLTTQRYAHLAPSAHDSAREVWAQIFRAYPAHGIGNGPPTTPPPVANVQVTGVRPVGIEPTSNGLEGS